MAHIGARSIKAVEVPRPLKSQTRFHKNNAMIIEELIGHIERVAASLQSGNNDTEAITTLAQNLRVHGPQLESVSKDTLDRAFVVFRNSSQDERLNIMTRLNLLELIELRAKSWEDNGLNAYYKTKQATNIELNDTLQPTDATVSTFLSTPTIIGNTSNSSVLSNVVGSPNQQQLLLGPGEIIRNSGKFSKPTRIPGKSYCKDEVVIRNADSGKVNHGAKERLVQITGPSEDKIDYAKHLIEDTIKRNASPVRLDMTSMGNGNNGGGGNGSCSSLASSNSDEVGHTRVGSSANTSNLINRISFNSNQSMPISIPIINNATTSNTLLHSYSTSDASLGEYKFTCNVGQHVIKITGDCCDLVRVAKLVLDDYFSSGEFLASFEIGAGLDTTTSSASIPLIGGTLNSKQSMVNDSVYTSNYMPSQPINNNSANHDADDDVFVDGKSTLQNNSGIGITRIRRSHFSRKDCGTEAATYQSTQGAPVKESKKDNNTRIVHQYVQLVCYAKSPHSWALPNDWQRICEKFPSIVRNKVNSIKNGHESQLGNRIKISSPFHSKYANMHVSQSAPMQTYKSSILSNVTNTATIDLKPTQKLMNYL